MVVVSVVVVNVSVSSRASVGPCVIL
jgi:hypothetical protein